MAAPINPADSTPISSASSDLGGAASPLMTLPPPSAVNQVASTGSPPSVEGGGVLQGIGKTLKGSLAGISMLLRATLAVTGFLVGGAIKYGVGIPAAIVFCAIDGYKGNTGEGFKIGLAFGTAFGATMTGLFLLMANECIWNGGDSETAQGFNQVFKGVTQMVDQVAKSLDRLDYEEVMNKPCLTFLRPSYIDTSFVNTYIMDSNLTGPSLMNSTYKPIGPNPDLIEKMKGLCRRLEVSQDGRGVSGRIDDLLEFKGMRGLIEQNKGEDGGKALSEIYNRYSSNVKHLHLEEEILRGLLSNDLSADDRTSSLKRLSAVAPLVDMSKSIQISSRKEIRREDQYIQAYESTITSLEKLSPEKAKAFLDHIENKWEKNESKKGCIVALKEHLRHLSDSSNPSPSMILNSDFFKIVDGLLKSFIAKEIEKALF
jgi:hypothetical protein